MRPCRYFLFLLLILSLGLPSCDSPPPQQRTGPIFAAQAPQNEAFKLELQYLEAIEKLNPEERIYIENQLQKVEENLGVPKSLLWCVLFQESRFDSFKNATQRRAAKGIGQFTQVALDEINDDTDEYDLRTSSVLNAQLTPKSLPISFYLKFRSKSALKKRRNPASFSKPFPEQPITSYFRTSTAIFSSAAYLNNRYQQLRGALEHQGIPYDPQVLWLYAAAAYNKGSRSIFVLLTHEYLLGGEKSLIHLLQDVKATHDLFTHPERIEYPFREIWSKRVRKRYTQELLRNMQFITSCALSEQSI